uniref:Uncharacterized protein n=1 Tax=Macrostomum lignano TaxID=282301 RepID=A0A1I8JQM8_9PLAT
MRDGVNLKSADDCPEALSKNRGTEFM